MPGQIQRDAQGNFLIGPLTPTSAMDPVTGAQLVETEADASYGATPFAFVNTGTFAQQAVKAGPGTLYGGTFTNNSGAVCFIQIFNLPTGSVTPGTTVPVVEKEVANGAATDLLLPGVGVNMNAGITVFASTTEGGATGSAAGVKAVLYYN